MQKTVRNVGGLQRANAGGLYTNPHPVKFGGANTSVYLFSRYWNNWFINFLGTNLKSIHFLGTNLERTRAGAFGRRCGTWGGFLAPHHSV